MRMVFKNCIRYLIIVLSIITIIVFAVVHYNKVWSEKPINTNREEIREIMVTYAYRNYDMPEEQWAHFLQMIDKMRFKKRKLDDDGMGGVLSVNPRNTYKVSIYYKDGNYNVFQIISKANCIWNGNDLMYYYYKKYDKKAMNDLLQGVVDGK